MYISVIAEAKKIFVLYFATADMFYFDVSSGINKNGVT